MLVNGGVVGTFTPSGSSYQPYTTAAFTVSAGAHTIAFQGLDSAGGDNTAFVNAVAVSVAQSGTPGTATTALMSQDPPAGGGSGESQPAAGGFQELSPSGSGPNDASQISNTARSNQGSSSSAANPMGQTDGEGLHQGQPTKTRKPPIHQHRASAPPHTRTLHRAGQLSKATTHQSKAGVLMPPDIRSHPLLQRKLM